MSTEELWQLFPISLSEHQTYWKQWYFDEETALKEILPPDAKIHHIGSTSADLIWAKPIIDILVEIPDTMDFGKNTSITEMNIQMQKLILLSNIQIKQEGSIKTDTD